MIMDLKITGDQERYLSKKGLIDARALKAVYKESVQKQRDIKDKAAKIRSAQK